MSFKVIFNELYEFIKSNDRWWCFIIRRCFILDTGTIIIILVIKIIKNTKFLVIHIMIYYDPMTYKLIKIHLKIIIIYREFTFDKINYLIINVIVFYKFNCYKYIIILIILIVGILILNRIYYHNKNKLKYKLIYKIYNTVWKIIYNTNILIYNYWNWIYRYLFLKFILIFFNTF